MSDEKPLDEKKVHPSISARRLRVTRWQKHSRPSKVGADAAEPRAGTQRARIYALVLESGAKGVTSDELYDLLNEGIDQGCLEERLERIPKNLVRARLSGLRDDGLVADSGRERPSRHGVPNTVWVAAKWAPPKEMEF